MFESLAALVLNNYLGQYLESVNTDQLSVALLQGAVELENVPLRRDALVGFDVPFSVKTGFVGKVRLSIPMRRLGSESWSINIEQLYVVLGPVDVENLDTDAESDAARVRKLQKLDAEEAAWRSEMEAVSQCSYYSSTYTSWMRYGSSMVSNIVSNLQLNIRDVHVRFEDAESIAGHCLAVGLTLSSLTAQSCDNRWTPGYVAEAHGSMRYKLLELSRIDVYWDTSAEPYAEMSLGNLAEKMFINHKHEFILSPVSLEARWKRDCMEAPLRSYDRPRHTLQIQCDRLCLSLSATQFRQCVLVTRAMELLNRRRRHARYRPCVSVLQSPAEWWRFAILCHLEPIQLRRASRSCAVVSERCGQLLKYSVVYNNHLKCPAMLSGTDLSIKDEIEHAWSEDELRAIRSWWMYRVTEDTRRTAESSQQIGLLNWWQSSRYEEPSQTAASADIDFDSAVSSSVENSSIFTRDFVFCALSFSLSHMNVQLLSSSTSQCDLFDVCVEQTDVDLEWRPRICSYSVKFSLGSFVVRDHATPNSAFPQLVAPLVREVCTGKISKKPAQSTKLMKNASSNESLPSSSVDLPLVEVLFERKPIHVKADLKLHVNSRSVEIVYSPFALEAVRKFFTVSDKYAETFVELGEAAKCKYQRTREDLIHSWEHMLECDNLSREIWDVRLNVAAPHIILPEKLNNSSGLLLVIDLGFFKLHNASSEASDESDIPALSVEYEDEDDKFCTPCSSPTNEPVDDTAEEVEQTVLNKDNISMDTIRQQLYDKFNVELGNMQVLVGCVSDGWRRALSTGVSHLHLLDKFSVCVQLERCRLPASSVGCEWPLCVLSAQLDKLMLHSSEFKIKSLFTLLTTFSLRQPSSTDVSASGAEDHISSNDSDARAPASADTVAATDGHTLLKCSFTVGQVALSVESRGSAICELQVSDARLLFSKQRRRLHMEMSIHNLLLVDAMQSYGAGYEILMASHRDVSVDSVSGSLLDTHPGSSSSGSSIINAPETPGGVCSRAEYPSESLGVDVEHGSEPFDALIHLVITVNLPRTDNGVVRQQISVKFNALDVIANQQTIMEIFGFVDRVSCAYWQRSGLSVYNDTDTIDDRLKGNTWLLDSPVKTVPSTLFSERASDHKLDPCACPDREVNSLQVELTDRKQCAISDSGQSVDDSVVRAEIDSSDETTNNVMSTHTSLELDFCKLNVLLLRCIESQPQPLASKIATVTISNAHMELNQVESQRQVVGSLGGLQMRRLCDRSASAVVLSVGHDPLIKRSQELLQCFHSRLYSDQVRSALQFSFHSEDSQKLQLQLASVCYIHSVKFLYELGYCVDEFARYFDALAGAAADVASHQSNLHISCVLDSPILVLPEGEGSCDLLVAHLGQIKLHNPSYRYYDLNVCDMNLYSLDLRRSLKNRGLTVSSAASLLSCEQLYDVTVCGDPIIYNTGVEMSIDLTSGSVCLEHKFSTALRVSVLKSQYEQIMCTISNLSADNLSSTVPSGSRDNISIDPPSSPLAESKPAANSSMAVNGNFNLSRLEVELRSDVYGSKPACGLVMLALTDLTVSYLRDCDGSNRVEMVLQEVLMEDLLMDPHNPHRFLLSSLVIDDRLQLRRTSSLSTSCPCLSSHACDDHHDTAYGSLPNHLLLKHGSDKRWSVATDKQSCTCRHGPVTPPPSPERSKTYSGQRPSDDVKTGQNDALIRCVLRGDQDADGTYQQSVDVVFGGLKVILTPQSWVMVLDFFSRRSRKLPSRTVLDRSLSTGESHSCTISPVPEERVYCTINVRVRNLSLLMNHQNLGALARVEISHLECCCSLRMSSMERLSGRLGSMELFDLNNRVKNLYSKRFTTTSSEAVYFEIQYYTGDDRLAHGGYDGRFELRLSPVLYVHTQRFTTELGFWVAEFNQLQRVLENMQSMVGNAEQPAVNESTLRLNFDLQVGAPVLMLPVESGSDYLLVVNLGRLQVSNSLVTSQEPLIDGHCDFKNRRDFTFFRRVPADISVSDSVAASVYDVVEISLADMHVYTARRVDDVDIGNAGSSKHNLFMGSYSVQADAKDCHIVHDTFSLQLKVSSCLERGEAQCQHPDILISGRLSTLACRLSLMQYCLICEMFRRNIGETVNLPVSTVVDAVLSPGTITTSNVSKTSSPSFRFCLLLQNVSLELLQSVRDSLASIARVDFVRSQVIYDSVSNGLYELALLSHHIQLLDTRYSHIADDRKPNVFPIILQPLSSNGGQQVCAELSYRVSPDRTEMSCVLTNMRLIGLPDWWLGVISFFTSSEPCFGASDSGCSSTEYPVGLSSVAVSTTGGVSPVSIGVGVVTRRAAPLGHAEKLVVNSKLILSNCELVLMENQSQFDTVAVILKANTACLTHRPSAREKPLSCEIQGCEVFSCVMGVREHETALSIVDPFTMNVDIVSRAGNAPRGFLEVHDTPSVYNVSVCIQHLCLRLSYHDGRLFLSMLQNIPQQTLGASNSSASRVENSGVSSSEITSSNEHSISTPNTSSSLSNLKHLELHLTSFSLFIIDDYGDADVPLLELRLNQVVVRGGSDGAWLAHSRILVEYYNRLMSGWEPLIEPIKCSVTRQLIAVDSRHHTHFSVSADQSLNINLTTTALQLARSVIASWSHGGGGRRRSHFVPFTLLNKTGCVLRMRVESADQWTSVDIGKSVSFTFADGRTKKRHGDTHSVQRRRILVWLDGWQPCLPVSIDKVGVYFREIIGDVETMYKSVRLVFAIEMDGAARKMITARSSFQLHNRLQVAVRVKGVSLRCDSLYLSAGQKEPLPMLFINRSLSFQLMCDNKQWTEFSNPWSWWNSDMSSSFLCKLPQRNWSSRFAVVLHSDGFPPHTNQTSLPGHTAVIQAPLCLTNLLPCELRFSIHEANLPEAESGRIAAGGQISVMRVDAVRQIYITVWAEGFRAERPLDLSSIRASSSAPVNFILLDDRNRRLILHLRFECCVGCWYNVSVAVPFWLVNCTGLPLIAGQEGADPVEAAAQETAHEQARSVAPLLFSLSDPDAPEMMVLRLGRGQHSGAIVRWCSRFPLQPGICQRRLRVSPTNASQSDFVYEVGIVIRRGNGRYTDTHIITISPLYQLENRTNWKLLVTQASFANLAASQTSRDLWLTAMPRSQMAFHWTKFDSDHLLCVKMSGSSESYWSGPFPINRIGSLCLNLRDTNGSSQLIRVEIVSQGATLNIVFLDTCRLPPPIKLTNTSEVSVTFWQSVVHDFNVVRGVVRPGTSVPYSWDRPMESTRRILMAAPGGNFCEYDLEQPGEKESLQYDIMIFLSMTATFNADSSSSSFSAAGMSQLVLDVVNGLVVLRRKVHGSRSQLWRHLESGHLVHEGSITPGQDMKDGGLDLMVLDIAAVAVQPNKKTQLCLRRRDVRRSLTQIWRFTQNGQLQCNVPNVCVQVEHLGEHCPVMLGLLVDTAVSCIQPQLQWPGSGRLAVRVYIEGPTRVLYVSDMCSRFPRCTESAAVTTVNSSLSSWNVNLLAGIVVSVISSSVPIEILCLHLSDVCAEVRIDSVRLLVDLRVRYVQCDCHLPETQVPVVLFAKSAPDKDSLPAVDFSINWQFSEDPLLYVFKHAILKLKDLNVRLEERFLYELLLFFSETKGHDNSNEHTVLDFSGVAGQLRQSSGASLDDQCYFITRLEVALRRITLSVLTASRLESRLAHLRREFGLRLVQFENAQVELDRFVRNHLFETPTKIVDLISEHYREELKSQAAIVLVSTDFLGNPLGFFNDVSEGVSGLMTQGDVGGLIKNVTHGMANSAAKVTGSLSDVVGWATMDEKHDDKRRRIRQVNSATEGHLIGGVKGLGLGLWGGASSLLVQPIQGAVDQGLWGFVSGIGKGIVGTVAKPAVGFLDLAAGTANAVKDTSRRPDRQAPSQLRPTRVVQGPDGLLPTYNVIDAEAQMLLRSALNFNRGERYVACRLLRRSASTLPPDHPMASASPELRSVGHHDLRILVSTQMVRVFSHTSPGQYSLKRTFPLAEILNCYPKVLPATGGSCSYQLVIEMLGDLREKPTLPCDTDEIAVQAAELLNYMRAYHEEICQTLVPRSIGD